MAPRLIELCFQTAGLWEIGMQSRMGLPQHLIECACSAQPEKATGHFMPSSLPNRSGEVRCRSRGKYGNCYLRLSGYRTVHFLTIDAEPLKVLQRRSRMIGFT